MSEEKKVLQFEMDGASLRIKVDPNKDGQPIVDLMVDLAEVPDEILDAFSKKE